MSPTEARWHEMEIIEQPAGRRNTKKNHPEIAIHLKAVRPDEYRDPEKTAE